ncbi:MAG: hypothetical protein IID18_10645 [Nitrospinae bacterium]|nr:hypothetical protein [Nitrospinota bacterium]
MMELLFIVYILLLFVFPLPALAVLLGLFTTWGLHRKYQLVKLQPPTGRGLLRLNIIASSLNLIASLAVALALAVLVYAVIFDFLYLFAFNLIFCFAIALRWFDFTHEMYRRAVLKLKPSLLPVGEEHFFVTIKGLREVSGFGPVLVPVFAAAGYLVVNDSSAIFEGVFTHLSFEAAALTRIEKKSSDKIRIICPRQGSGPAVDAYLIALKDQFYPFKSRSRRDHIVSRLAPVQTTPVELSAKYS